MNKKVFKVLIVLMGISILGIIAVQLVWMNNALRIRNELFDRSVTEVLTLTTERLETIHDLDIIKDIEPFDSLRWKDEEGDIFSNDSSINHGMVFTKKTPKLPPNVSVITKTVKPVTKSRIELKINTDVNTDKEYAYQYKRNSNHVIVDDECLTNDIVIISLDSIYNGIDSLFEIKIEHIDSVVTSLEDMDELPHDFSTRLRHKAVQLKHTAGKAVKEIKTWGIRKIDTKQISNILSNELKEKNIPISFELGVLKDSSIVFKGENADSILLWDSPYKTQLYPNDIFQKNLRLSVYFPERDSFIFKSINWLLAISFLFSMIILLTFTLSIFYMLKQKKISEMKSDFINNMTHEFKTPIATIAVATDSITNEKVIEDKDRIRYFTGMIKKENMRMNQQVEDILTIARLDNKEFEFKWEASNIHNIIENAIDGIILQIDKRDGKIITNFEATNPVVTTDKKHCTNIIYNLLDNANKYSPNSPEITVATRNSSKGVVISVEDKGIGMSKLVQSKIFERFYRQTSGNIHNVKGFGLGLSYVKAVVDANKGNITVQSEPGKGSKFEVFVPFARVSG